MELDKFWERVAFVIRTGDNVADSRVPGQMVTWVNELPRENVVYVSDADRNQTKAVEFEGYGASVPPIHDAVSPYAVPDDKDSLPTAAAWDKDFLKHLGAFDLLYKQVPDAQWYVMADDDTFVFLSQLKKLITKQLHGKKGGKHIFALCYPLTGDTPHAMKCGKYPPQPGPYYPAGGGGMILTRAAMLALKDQLPKCYSKYSNCWAGDRRLGACLWDAHVSCPRNAGWSSRDIQQELENSAMPLTTLHHVKPRQMLLLQGLVRNHTDVTSAVLRPYWRQLQEVDMWM